MSKDNNQTDEKFLPGDIEYNLEILGRQLQANERTILSGKLDAAGLLNLHEKQVKTMQAFTWVNNVKNMHFPPRIVAPNGQQSNGMHIIPPQN